MPIRQPSPPQTITINSVGVPQSYTKIVNVGSGATVLAAAAPVVMGASQVTGTIAQLTGGTLSDNGKFASTSTMGVAGATGFSDADGGASGANGSLTEGAKLLGNSVLGGDGGAALITGTGGKGGDGILHLDGTKTSWRSISVQSGTDGAATSGTGGFGGDAYVYLASTQSSAVFSLSLAAGTSSVASTYCLISGASLSSLSFTIVTGGSWNNSSVGPYFGISETIATNASQQNLANALIGLGISNGTLNAAGTCDAADGTTLALYTTLLGLGWTILNN